MRLFGKFGKKNTVNKKSSKVNTNQDVDDVIGEIVSQNTTEAQVKALTDFERTNDPDAVEDPEEVNKRLLSEGRNRVSTKDAAKKVQPMSEDELLGEGEEYADLDMRDLSKEFTSLNDSDNDLNEEDELDVDDSLDTDLDIIDDGSNDIIGDEELVDDEQAVLSDDEELAQNEPVNSDLDYDIDNSDIDNETNEVDHGDDASDEENNSQQEVSDVANVSESNETTAVSTPVLSDHDQYLLTQARAMSDANFQSVNELTEQNSYLINQVVEWSNSYTKLFEHLKEWQDYQMKIQQYIRDLESQYTNDLATARLKHQTDLVAANDRYQESVREIKQQVSNDIEVQRQKIEDEVVSRTQDLRESNQLLQNQIREKTEENNVLKAENKDKDQRILQLMSQLRVSSAHPTKDQPVPIAPIIDTHESDSDLNRSFHENQKKVTSQQEPKEDLFKDDDNW